MLITALDIATCTGFAHGEAGAAACPVSGGVILRRGAETPEDAAFNMLGWLRDRWTFDELPDLLFIEAPMNPAGQKSADAAILSMALYFAAVAAAKAHSVRVEKAAASTIRKHFIGVANMNERKATKAAVLRRCAQIGYLPFGSRDDNKADALAAWDYASVVYGRRQPTLAMIGGAS